VSDSLAACDLWRISWIYPEASSFRLPVCVCLLAVVPRFMGFAAESGEEHRAGRKQRVELDIEFDERAEKSTPVRVNVDFDALLPRGVSGLIDPHTIVVKRRLRGKTRTYNARFAENLYYKNQGWDRLAGRRTAERRQLDDRVRHARGRRTHGRTAISVASGSRRQALP